MGSLRNPIGPLPSSIYWRRRAVAAALVVLIALLIAWAVTSGGGSGDHHDDSKPPGSGPAGSITPGPSGSGPAITEQPGGGGESDGSGGSSGDEDGSSGGGSAGAGGSSDANGGGQDTGSGSASGSAGSGSGTGEGVQAARPVPAGSSLADCAAGAIRIGLKTERSYAPGEKPKFRLFVTNTSSTACKADFGPKSAVLTVTAAGGEDDEVWSSKDCPRDPKPVLIEVPAGTTVVHTVEWDRDRSAPKCATPPSGKARPGTYLVEAKAPGQPVQRASFVLEKD